MASSRWVRRPEGSNWGDFGPDDQLGRLNLLTPQKVLEGVAEVRAGQRFCLSLPLDLPGGNKLSTRRFPPKLAAVVRNGQPGYNYPAGLDRPGATDVVCDDLVTLHTQYSTQWDSLAHIGSMFDADGDGIPEKVYYNGYRADEHIVGPPSGTEVRYEPVHATALGIENMAVNGVQGRGVLVDLRAHLGMARQPVSFDQLMDIMRADAVIVEPGDMLCLHTGFAQQLVDWHGEPDPSLIHNIGCALDGDDARLLDWIERSGIAVLVADNFAVEFVHPAVEGKVRPMLPIHNLCLFKLGIHLGELWHLTELATWLRQAGRSRFLLTAPPLRLPGAVGSPTTPIATV